MDRVAMHISDMIKQNELEPSSQILIYKDKVTQNR